VIGAGAALASGAEDAQASSVNETAAKELSAMIAGFRNTQMIYVAAKLRLADHLKDGPRTIQHLANVTGAHPDSLYRLMRALAGNGVFVENAGMQFSMSPAAELLRTDAPGSMRSFAETSGEDWTWRPWGALLHSVRTGETAFNHLYGKGTFDWFAENPGPAALFNELQSELTARSSEAVVESYDFSSARTIVDIGGGEGVLLSAILRRNPAARGVLFELAHVIDSARNKMDAKVASRCDFLSGDFFKSLPAGADTYVLKHIIHDWDDGHAQSILNNCRGAMKNRAKLLLIEEIICPANQRCPAKIGDLHMLVRTGGRNRSEGEYRRLLEMTGFASVRVINTRAEISVIEASIGD
jgi:hypothetical protein